MLPYDLRASEAHAMMLCKIGARATDIYIYISLSLSIYI